MPKTKLITILLLLISAVVAPLTVMAEGRLFKRVPTAEGMEKLVFTTYDIERTNDGFIWMATDRGLIRCDGEHSVRVDLPGDEKGRQAVKALAPTDGNDIIAATTSGLFRLHTVDGHHTATPLLDGQPFPATCGLRAAGKYSLIAGDEGIVIFSPGGEMQRVMVGRDVLDLSNKIIDMAEGDNGVYLLTKGGIYFLNPENLAITPILDGRLLEPLSPSAIASARGKVYIGTTGNGIYGLEPASRHLYEAFSFSKGNVVTSMETGAGGSILYVGTDGGGITKIDTASDKILEQMRHVSSDPISPLSNQVYSLFADPASHLWVGYYQSGADYTPSWTGPFELIDDPAVFNTRNVPVRALSIADGRITIGTRDGIVVFEHNCSTAWVPPSGSLRSRLVISLLDHDGKTYIGTYGGGCQVFDPAMRTFSDVRMATSDPVFRSGHIFAMAADKRGNLWFGTNNGLFRKSPEGKLTHFTPSDSSLPSSNVYGIFFDSEGKGWICTDKGLCVYDPYQEKLRTDLFPAAFPSTTRFRTVFEDSRKSLYFVPENGKVIRSGLDLSEANQLTGGLFEDTDAKGVTEDSHGNIWITTNRGIFRLDSKGCVLRFGLAAGLPSPVFLQSQPLSDSCGHIWFGNAEGLLRLNEAEIESSIEAQRHPVPTTLKVNGRNVDFIPYPEKRSGHYVIDLDKASNTVKIGFSTFSYAFEEPEAYLYSLDGDPWKSFDKDLSVTFYELSPGSHELRVKSANDCEADTQFTVVRMRVPYPFWWYIIGLLIIVLIIVAAVGIIMHIKRRKREALEAEERAEREARERELENSSATSADADAAGRAQKKYASNTLSRTEAREISKNVDEVMETQKPYLNADLKVGDLAAMVGISSHKLSQFFSQYKQQAFYDYVNAYRVQEFKRIVKSDNSHRHLTLTALSEKAGFSSRASFFRYFKNVEGISPGEWIKNLDKD